MSARRRQIRILTTSGLLHVIVCEYCAALVVTGGAEQHARVHVATGPNGRGDGCRTGGSSPTACTEL